MATERHQRFIDDIETDGTFTIRIIERLLILAGFSCALLSRSRRLLHVAQLLEHIIHIDTASRTRLTQWLQELEDDDRLRHDLSSLAKFIELRTSESTQLIIVRTLRR
jgi:hypothetical protein